MTEDGFIERHPLVSEALVGNRFDDPTERLVTIYLPPAYNRDTDKTYPIIYLLPSHGNTGESFLNWKPWSETMEDRLDRLIKTEEMPPAIFVMPDMWTTLGSSQYLNSTIGNYEDYLVKEIVPFIDDHYRGNGKRGLIGHSSGGYGAVVQAIKHPDLFHGFASHAGDMYWEYTCLPNIKDLHQALTSYGGVEQFLAEINDIRPKSGRFWQTIMTLCWSMAHGTNPDAALGFDMPIDIKTGALDERVWKTWLTFDPIRLVDDDEAQAALQGMELVYIAAGTYDEYQLQVGARVLSKKLTAFGIDHIHEEQPIGHSGSDVPYDRSIRLMVDALTTD